MSLYTRNLPPLFSIIVCFVLSAAAYPYLDDRVPVHWGVDGEISKYAHRHVAVFLNPAAAIVALLFFLFVPYADKRRASQLSDLGIFLPIRNAAVYAFTYAHILAMGTGTGLIPRSANYVVGVAALLAASAGYALRAHDTLPFSARLAPATRTRVSWVCAVTGGIVCVAATFGVWPPKGLAVLLATVGWSAWRISSDLRA